MSPTEVYEACKPLADEIDDMYNAISDLQLKINSKYYQIGEYAKTLGTTMMETKVACSVCDNTESFARWLLMK